MRSSGLEDISRQELALFEVIRTYKPSLIEVVIYAFQLDHCTANPSTVELDSQGSSQVASPRLFDSQ